MARIKYAEVSPVPALARMRMSRGAFQSSTGGFQSGERGLEFVTSGSRGPAMSRKRAVTRSETDVV